MDVITIVNSFGFKKVVEKAYGEKMIRNGQATAYNPKEEKEAKLKEIREAVEPIKEGEEDNVDLEFKSVPELMAILDGMGIEYKKNAKKPELLSLLNVGK